MRIETRYLLSCAFHTQGAAQLTEFSVVVVEQELGLLLKTGIADLLSCPLERRMVRDVCKDHLTTHEFHDQEYIENTKANRVLNKEVTAPYGLGLVL